MDFLTGVFSKAKSAVTGSPAAASTAPSSVTDGYPPAETPVGARRRRKTKKTKKVKAGRRRKTMRRV